MRDGLVVWTLMCVMDWWCVDINGSCRLIPSHTLHRDGLVVWKTQNAMNAVVAAEVPASCATLVRSVGRCAPLSFQTWK